MMITKKDLVVAVLITFCLTASLFLLKFVRSQSAMPYDPWADINDDGTINMKDIGYIARLFGTSGDPVNKTELLYNVNDTLTSLLAKIDSLNSSLLSLQAYLNMRVTTLEATVGEQQVRIADLEIELAILNATKLGRPDYDSGWWNITAGQQIIFDHDLGTTNVLVYMIGNDTSGTLYIHQIKYGADSSLLSEFGCRWQELTFTSIKVIRSAQDPNWNQVRIMIWKIPT